MKRETVVVLDFGGQYNQLIARRVRECNVYCEIYSYRTDIETIKALNPKGIIFTGGPNSCYEEGAPSFSKEIFSLGIPVLGICYGAQLMMHLLGGRVGKAQVREYGKIEVSVYPHSLLFQDVSPKTICWMSHNDFIEKPAPDFVVSAWTEHCPVAAAENAEKQLYALQFHPEVLHTQEGKRMLANFVYRGDSQQGRQRQGAVRPVRRCGFLRGGRHDVEGRGKPADMCVCGSWPSQEE